MNISPIMCDPAFHNELDGTFPHQIMCDPAFHNELDGTFPHQIMCDPAFHNELDGCRSLFLKGASLF